MVSIILKILSILLFSNIAVSKLRDAQRGDRPPIYIAYFIIVVIILLV